MHVSWLRTMHIQISPAIIVFSQLKEFIKNFVFNLEFVKQTAWNDINELQMINMKLGYQIGIIIGFILPH